MRQRIPVPLEVVFCTDPKTGALPVFEGVKLEFFAEAIAEIAQCILDGDPVPEKYYRKSEREDRLLRQRNWFHLHPGPHIDNDVLLIIEVQQGTAVFIGLTTHKIFLEIPKGRSIKKALGSQLARIRMSKR